MEVIYLNSTLKDECREFTTGLVFFLDIRQWLWLVRKGIKECWEGELVVCERFQTL